MSDNLTRSVVKTRSMVTATFQLEGVHQFLAVDEMLKEQSAFDNNKDVPFLDVSFLKFPHRHIFKFEIAVDVHHNDRDIEFIQLGRILCNAMKLKYPIQQFGCHNFGNRSCEMLAEEVLEIFLSIFPHYLGEVTIQVWEDEENSAFALFNVTDMSENND